jgi:hypothetical protein
MAFGIEDQIGLRKDEEDFEQIEIPDAKEIYDITETPGGGSMKQEITDKMINFVYRYNQYSPSSFSIYKSAKVGDCLPATIFTQVCKFSFKIICQILIRTCLSMISNS